MRGKTVRIVVALAIVAWLLTQAGLESVVNQLRRAQVLPVVFAFAAVAGDSGLRTFNWRQLLSAISPGQRIPFTRLLTSYLGAGLLGSFVPSTAGTDLLRAGMSHRSLGGHFASHAAAVLLQNAVTAVVACLLGLLGYAALGVVGEIPMSLVPVAGVLAVIAVAAPAAYVILRLRRDLVLALFRRLGRRWFRLRRSMRRFFRAVMIFDRAKLSLSRVIAVAAAALVSQSLGYAFAGWALDTQLPFGAWLLLPSVVAIAGLLPASFLGFGATQAANSYVLAACGVPLADAVAIATLATVVSLVFRAVAGGAAMALWPSRPT